MRKKKQQAKIVDVQTLDNGDVRLTTTRPHGVLQAGVVINLHNGPHTIVSVQNKFILTARKWKWHTPYRLRAQAAWRLVVGKPRPLRDRLAGLFGKGAR